MLRQYTLQACTCTCHDTIPACIRMRRADSSWAVSPRQAKHPLELQDALEFISIACVVDVCRGLPATVPATGSNCKSRDYRRVCYPNGSTPRMWGIGSPSTRCPVRY